MDYIKQRNRKLGQNVTTALQKRHFGAFYCETKEDALKKVSELVDKSNVVSWGGSMSLFESGIIDFFEKNNYKIIDRDKASTPEERTALTKQALTCDTFLMSSNAVSEDGQLVNIDGLGNRVAALCYGPKQVIVVVGMNKVVKNLDDAIQRTRTYAAPVNLQRIDWKFPRQTPCVNSGSCSDCISPDSICAQVVVTRLSNQPQRIKVILVNEELGF